MDWLLQMETLYDCINHLMFIMAPSWSTMAVISKNEANNEAMAEAKGFVSRFKDKLLWSI